jgi:hypothetical protein
MKVADLTTATAKLQHALTRLKARWEETQNDWHDPVSLKFEEDYLEAIEPQVLATLERLSSLAQVMRTAEQECS